ncbi:hypothetical protein ACFQY4_05265 [Catellatospora bangladeshensis]|uniref:Uncharacterized protein n=1 Tax=Catellatospora bangladeshensis TaxID=310355 RepID=A0A8J3JSS4_9ACTN|nr:hypothetical protein [Catellatospora bangladeshensis]GIF83119.1 hypothetical protein Cba03nite_44680 [Catellatospora bangladeshensis]
MTEQCGMRRGTLSARLQLPAGQTPPADVGAQMFGDDTVGRVDAEECGGRHRGSDRLHG